LPAANVAYDHSFWFARLLQHDARRRFALLNEMAMQQTLGGGWACLRVVEKAVYHAIRLYTLAQELGDEATMRKCRVFIGYAQVWNGDFDAARQLVDEQFRDSENIGDDINRNRCIAARILLSEEMERRKSITSGDTTSIEAGSQRETADPAAPAASNDSSSVLTQCDDRWRELFVSTDASSQRRSEEPPPA
jgi:hypothetical protein